MRSRITLSIMLVAALLLPTVRASALNEAACRQQIAASVQVRHDEFRRVIFGSTAETASDRGTFVKTNGYFDGPDLPGILETRGRMTSELIEPITESYRVFRCNALNVCELLKNVIDNAAGDSFQVQHLGCGIQELPTLLECRFNGDGTQAQAQSLIEYCDNLVAETLASEEQAIKLAVGYDSSYRALLQVSGMFDAFLKNFARVTFMPLRQMVGLLGRLHQIPCFLPHCDAPPDSIGDPNP